PLRRRLPPAAPLVAIALVLGYCGVLYDLVALRAFQPLGLEAANEGVRIPLRRDTEVDRELRAAYEWIAANTDPHLVVQHNPDVTRAFSYGLYGRARVAVSD